jgi:nicotinamidase/pyrazinamidase
MTTAKGNIAIIAVDVQRDFTQLANGPLAVEGTDAHFIETVRASTETLKQAGFLVFATQDWHPREHVSFFTNHKAKNPFDVITIHERPQVLWPPHCVQETDGARLLLDENLFDGIVKKGTEIEFDSYSGFQDEGGHTTPLHGLLGERSISRTVIYGIATDYCVKATALDAAELGYQVIVIKTLTRGVDPETSKMALDEMDQRGVVVIDDLDLRRIKS